MQTHISKDPRNIFSSIKKAIIFKNSALIPYSFLIACVVQDVIEIEIKKTIYIKDVFLSIFTESVVRGILISLFVFIVGIVMYLIIFVFDFITGLEASKKEHFISAGTTKGYIQSDKLWSSVWKFFAVVIISFILTMISSTLSILQQDILGQSGVLITLFFFIMVISFDIHSIGENQERRFGYKPEFYNRMEWVFDKIENLLMLRFKKLIGIDTEDDTYKMYRKEKKQSDHERDT